MLLLTVEDMVTLLRNSVNVQIPVIDEDGNEVGTEVDPNYLSMTDDDLMLYLKLGVTRAFPSVQDMNHLPDGAEYPLILLAKIQLYQKLAITVAPKIDIGADNNNYLKQDQKFQHYKDLMEGARDEYDAWLENEGSEVTGTKIVNTYDFLLSRRHYSHRNYEKQPTPVVRVFIDEVTADSVRFNWDVAKTSHFGRFLVFFNKGDVLDPYAEIHEGQSYKSKILPGAKCLKSTTDFRDTAHCVQGLLPNTEYHIAVVSVERNQVFGYDEVSFITLSESPPQDETLDTAEEDFSIEEYVP